MKIMVFGDKGRLGKQLVYALSQVRDIMVISVGRSDCDVRQPGVIADTIDHVMPDVVINATAFNGLEACATDPFQAMAVNSCAPLVFAGMCRKRGALLIHFSTDYVFNGDPFGLAENTPINPCGFYGKSKWWGEEAVNMIASPHLIFRLSSLYGSDYAGMLGPVKQALDGKGSANDPIKVLDQICAPTSTLLVATTIRSLLSNFSLKEICELTGTYHLATSDAVSKLAFTKILLPYVLDHNVPRAGGALWHVAIGELSIPRPKHTVLIPKKFEDTFGMHMPSWKSDLRSMLPFLDPLPGTLVGGIRIAEPDDAVVVEHQRV
jgi:dTDP-4-dehydrorhamnose reductase